MLGVGVVIGIVYTVLMQIGKREVTPVVEEFLHLVDRGEYRQAYNSIGDGWRGKQSFEEFCDLHMLVRSSFGALKSLRLTSINVQKNLGEPNIAKTVFSARFAKGPATLTATLRMYSGSWKIEGMHYGSDVLAERLTCPHCGAINAYDANFCSNCGAKIERPREDVVKKRKAA